MTCQNAQGVATSGSAGLAVSAPTPTGRLSQVRSFEYAIGVNTGTAGVYPAIANSAVDLIILGGGSYDPPLDRSAADPDGTKLIFGYQDVSEAAAYMFPQFFVNGTVPSWFGNQNPGFPGLYSVQYWNPAWEPALFANIDKIVANGYDGVFLDVLDGDNEWSAGNLENNPVYPNAVQAMATLLSDIRTHISTTFPGKTIYLIGNNPTEVATGYTSYLRDLDAIFNEVLYYGVSPTNGLVSQYSGTSFASYLSSTLGPLLETAAIPIFGNDYPTPLSDPSAVSLSVDYYSALGWLSSVTTASQGLGIFSTGPFVFVATPNNPTVTGPSGFANFISGGLSSNATLTGGNQGDYFIGGPGQNSIVGGAGNDTIYAHPRNAGNKNRLTVDLSSNIEGTGSTPSVSIAINGDTVLSPTPITAAFGSSTQTYTFDTTAYSSISSVVLTVTGADYFDQNNFSNVQIGGVSFNGVSLNLGNGTYSSGGLSYGGAFTNNGTVSFPAPAFQVTSSFPANTSDTIDGGGGTNSVIYRGAYSDYTVTQQAGGSWLVTSKSTAEGPDTLTNIQTLIFSDQQISLP